MHLLMYLLSPFPETVCGKTSRGMCYCGMVETLQGFCMYVNPLTGAPQLMDPLAFQKTICFKVGWRSAVRKHRVTLRAGLVY